MVYDHREIARRAADFSPIVASSPCNADYIVSGDRHLLNLKEHAGMRIPKASEFLSILPRD